MSTFILKKLFNKPNRLEQACIQDFLKGGGDKFFSKIYLTDRIGLFVYRDTDTPPPPSHFIYKVIEAHKYKNLSNSKYPKQNLAWPFHFNWFI